MRGRWTLAIVGLILIVAGSLLAHFTQTAGGIRIEDVGFKGAKGNTMSALLYVPPNATAQIPAPGILAALEHAFAACGEEHPGAERLQSFIDEATRDHGKEGPKSVARASEAARLAWGSGCSSTSSVHSRSSSQAHSSALSAGTWSGVGGAMPRTVLPSGERHRGSLFSWE